MSKEFEETGIFAKECDPQNLIGRSIISIDNDTINCWKIKCSDGSIFELWGENCGPYGISQLILVREE